MRLPFADAHFCLELFFSVLLGLVDSAPNCWCGCLQGIGLLSIHKLGGFGSRLLMRIFARGWFTFIFQICWIRFPIADADLCLKLVDVEFIDWQIRLTMADVDLCFELVYFQCIDLLHAASSYWWGIFGIGFLSFCQYAGFGSQLVMWMFAWDWFSLIL